MTINYRYIFYYYYNTHIPYISHHLNLNAVISSSSSSNTIDWKGIKFGSCVASYWQTVFMEKPNQVRPGQVQSKSSLVHMSVLSSVVTLSRTRIQVRTDHRKPSHRIVSQFFLYAFPFFLFPLRPTHLSRIKYQMNHQFQFFQ